MQRTERLGGDVEPMIGILELMRLQPIAISPEQEGEVVQFGAQRRRVVRPIRQFRKL
jgi:hypothetical protein